MHNYSYPVGDITNYIFIDIIYYCIVPLVYIGNLSTIILLAIVIRARRKPADLLVAFMAFNDFCLAAFLCTPTLIATDKGEWFGKTSCYIFAHIYSCHLNVKFFVVILISIDRYLAIMKPFRYLVIVTEFRISVTLGSYVLLVCAIVGLIFLVTEPILMPGWFCTMRLWKESLNTTGTTKHDEMNSETGLIVCFSGLIIYGLVGICVMLFCNFSVIHVFKKKTNLAKAERRFMYMMVVIVIAFLVVWIPHAVTVLVCFNFIDWCPQAYYHSYRFIVVSAGWNPFIYVVVKPGYREGYWILAKKCLQVLSLGLYNGPPKNNETISQLIRNDIAPHAFIYPDLSKGLKRHQSYQEKKTSTKKVKVSMRSLSAPSSSLNIYRHSSRVVPTVSSSTATEELSLYSEGTDLAINSTECKDVKDIQTEANKTETDLSINTNNSIDDGDTCAKNTDMSTCQEFAKYLTPSRKRINKEKNVRMILVKPAEMKGILLEENQSSSKPI